MWTCGGDEYAPRGQLRQVKATLRDCPCGGMDTTAVVPRAACLTGINAAPLRLSYKASPLRPLFQSESLGSVTNKEIHHETNAPSRLQARGARTVWIDARCLRSGTGAAHCQAM